MEPLEIDSLVRRQTDFEIEGIDVESIDREKVLVFPGSLGIEHDVGFQQGIEQQVPDNHLHVVRDRRDVEVGQIADELLDDLLFMRRFLLIGIVDPDVHQEIRETAEIIRLFSTFVMYSLYFSRNRLTPKFLW